MPKRHGKTVSMGYLTISVCKSVSSGTPTRGRATSARPASSVLGRTAVEERSVRSSGEGERGDPVFMPRTLGGIVCKSLEAKVCTLYADRALSRLGKPGARKRRRRALWAVWVNGEVGILVPSLVVSTERWVAARIRGSSVMFATFVSAGCLR